MSAKKNFKSPYQFIVDRIIKEIEENGELPWTKSWTYDGVNRPTNFKTGVPYKGVNMLLLNFFNPYSSNHFLTYKQAKSLGGNVKEGEHGFPISYFQRKLYKVTNEDGSPKIDPSTGKQEERMGAVVKSYTVFNAEQIEGIDFSVDQAEYRQITSDIDLNDFTVNMPDRPVINEIEQGRAFYSLNDDSITMPKREQFNSDDEFFSVFFHELTHSTGAEHRLNRDGFNLIDQLSDDDKKLYSFEELVAELGAAMQMNDFGRQYDYQNGATYIKGWSNYLKDNPKALFQAAAKAEKAIEYIGNNEQSYEEAQEADKTPLVDFELIENDIKLIQSEKGLEVHFPGVPSDDDKKFVKELGFSYSRKKNMWYVYENERNAINSAINRFVPNAYKDLLQQSSAEKIEVSNEPVSTVQRTDFSKDFVPGKLDVVNSYFHVSFDKKPHEEQLKALKTLGFYWSREEKVWKCGTYNEEFDNKLTQAVKPYVQEDAFGYVEQENKTLLAAEYISKIESSHATTIPNSIYGPIVLSKGEENYYIHTYEAEGHLNTKEREQAITFVSELIDTDSNVLAKDRNIEVVQEDELTNIVKVTDQQGNLVDVVTISIENKWPDSKDGYTCRVYGNDILRAFDIDYFDKLNAEKFLAYTTDNVTSVLTGLNTQERIDTDNRIEFQSWKKKGQSASVSIPLQCIWVARLEARLEAGSGELG